MLEPLLSSDIEKANGIEDSSISSRNDDTVDSSTSSDATISNEKHKTAMAWGRCVMVSGYLVLINIGAMLVLSFMGALLGYIENEAEEDKETREIMIYACSSIGLTLLNLATLYSLCQRSKSSNRHFKASLAVFGCCRDKERNNYPEATLPLGHVLHQIGSPVSLRTVTIFLLFSVALLILLLGALLGPLTLFKASESSSQDGDNNFNHVLVVLGGIAAGMWMMVWKLAANRGNFFMTPDNDDDTQIEEQDNIDETPREAVKKIAVVRFV